MFLNIRHCASAVATCAMVCTVATAHAKDSVEDLTKLLTDKSAQGRARAAYSLGEMGEPAKSAVTALAEAVKDPDPVVRRQAVKAIIAIHPGTEVTIPLFAKVMEDSDPGVRMRVLDAISNAGAAAVPGLIKALDNDKVAYWACIILRDLGPIGKDAVPALTKKLKDKQLEVPREAALALGAIGAAAAPALPELVAVLDKPDLREAATLAIGQIGSAPAGTDAKLQANAKSDDKFLSTLSYWALARLHPDDKRLQREAIEQLMKRLTDKEPFVRAAVVRAIASLPPSPEITLPLLDKTLQNADETTVRELLGAVASLGPAAVPRLIDALKYKKLREDVIIILGRNGPAAAPATEALAKLLQDDDTRVAVETALALGKIGPEAKSAVPALTAALARKACPNSHAIIFALGKIGPSAKSAEPKLRELMKSDDRSLASISAWAVTQLNPGSKEVAAQAVPIIVASLGETLPESRKAAIEALAQLGPLAKDSISSLEKLSKDKSPAVRSAAAKAIKAINSPQSK